MFASTASHTRRSRLLATFALATLSTLSLGACSQAGGTTVSADLSSTPPQITGDTVGTAAPVGGATGDDVTPPPPTSEAPLAADASTNAQLLRDGVVVRATPSDTADAVVTLDDRTSFGSVTTLLVLDQRNDWISVSLPTRPNGSTGWVKSGDVKLRTNDFSIVVDRSTHTLTVTRGGVLAATSPVAIGADATPTPGGTYYVTDLVENDNPTGPYGPYALGLSAHSEVLTEFGGGDGQVAIHGNNDASKIGQSVSNGCIRIDNELVRQLADIVPLGTPVTIV